MLEFINPETIGKPFSRYSHVVAAPENCRWVHVSGQVGVARDGSILEGFDAQARQAWANVLHGVRAAGMGLDDIVKINIFLTRREDIASSRSIRDEALQGRVPASTLLIVSGLAHPSLLLEIEAVAAQAAAPARPSAGRKAASRSKVKAKGKSRAKVKAGPRTPPKAQAGPKSRARARRP